MNTLAPRRPFDFAAALAIGIAFVVACAPISDRSKATPSEWASENASETVSDAPSERPSTAPTVIMSQTPGVTTTPVAQTSAPATPEASPSAPPAAGIWTTYTEPFAGRLAQTVGGVFVLGDGSLVAWGEDQEDDPGGYASVSFWSSPDWMNWTETKLEGLGPFIRVWDVANGPRGIVAAGAREDLGAVWLSTDAKNWTLSSVIDDDYEWSGVQAVAAGPDGFLVVGQHLRRATAWFSEDGTTWRSVGGDSLPDGRLYDVSTVADGSFIVVGVDDANPDHDAVVRLVSADGSTWRSAKLADGLATNEDDIVSEVWPYEGGFVAYGVQQDAARRHHCGRVGGECFPHDWPRLYTSPDGLSWEGFGDENELYTPALTTSEGPRLWEFDAVVPFGDGLLAAGSGTDFKVRLWTSRDGVTWDPMGDPILIAGHEAPPDYQVDTVRDLLVTDDRVVIGGELGGSDGYVMVAPLASI